MSDLKALLRQIFSSDHEVGDSINSATWMALTEAGLLRVGIDESLGGVGGELSDARTVVVGSAQAGVSGPLIDPLFVGSHLAARSGTPLPSGVVVAAVHRGQPWNLTHGEWQVCVSLSALPWVDRCDELWVLGPTSNFQSGLLRVSPDELVMTTGQSSLLDQRFDVDVFLDNTRVVVLPPEVLDEYCLVRALGRSCEMLGALRECLELSCRYAADRKQFRRPLASHQVIQHMLATMAADVAAAETAVAAAVERTAVLGTELGPEVAFAAAAAKVQTSIAATRVARSAHQLHGAMGMAAEYPLHHYTTRLWSWRDEDGSEGYWSTRIAELVRQEYGGDIWAALTAQSTQPTGSS
jgi:acyl-CoA dehydrogenase